MSSLSGNLSNMTEAVVRQQPERAMLSKMGRKFRSYDKFTVGRPQMKVDFDGAGPAYKSYMGAAVSITFIVLSSIFLYSKILVLYNIS